MFEHVGVRDVEASWKDGSDEDEEEGFVFNGRSNVLGLNFSRHLADFVKVGRNLTGFY